MDITRSHIRLRRIAWPWHRALSDDCACKPFDKLREIKLHALRARWTVVRAVRGQVKAAPLPPHAKGGASHALA